MNFFTTIDVEVNYQNTQYYIIGAVSNISDEPPTILCVWKYRDNNDTRGWELNLSEYEELLPVFEQLLQEKYSNYSDVMDAGKYS